MNVLYQPEIFLPSTALITVILLVWAQLSAQGKYSGEYTLYLGFTWIHSAILFTLFAFGLHVLESYKLAIGFLILSFLMAVAHVGYSTLRLWLIVFRHSPERSRVVRDIAFLTVVSRFKKWLLFGFFMFGLIGLGLISFSITSESDISRNPYLLAGIVLVGIVVLFISAKTVATAIK